VVTVGSGELHFDHIRFPPPPVLGVQTHHLEEGKGRRKKEEGRRKKEEEIRKKEDGDVYITNVSTYASN
jgi:hypothetical protein